MYLEIQRNIIVKETGELLIQYEESDWEFLKRIASIFGTGLVMEDGKSERKEEESNQGIVTGKQIGRAHV